jgi:hypothetical protein
VHGEGRGALVVALIGIALLLAISAGCAAEEDAPPATAPTTGPASPSPSPSATAGAPSPPPTPTPELSWQWLREREYRSWERAPGWAGPRTTDSPHSEAKEIFVDEALSAALGSGVTRYPAGATIVKEGFDAGGDLAIVAAMQRLPGRGWFFVEYRADGSVIVEGENPGLCTQCHRGAGDGVLAFDLE